MEPGPAQHDDAPGRGSADLDGAPTPETARSERRFYAWFSVAVLGLAAGAFFLVTSGLLGVIFDQE